MQLLGAFEGEGRGNEAAIWGRIVNTLEILVAHAVVRSVKLATNDALERAREELERACDRDARPEGGELLPRERERLRRLWTRSNALANARALMTADDPADRERHVEELVFLADMQEEADGALRRYRRQVGLED